MGWKEYYKRSEIRAFRENHHAYKWAISKLSLLNPSLLDPSHPTTFVLGGFTHTNSTRFDFEVLANTIHPHPTLIYLDQNSLPLSHTKHPHRVQAQLENLPLPPQSVDFIFLDHTQQFMDDNRLADFFHSASYTLKPNGLLLIANNSGLIPSLTSPVRSFFERIPNFLRQSDDICELSPLKTVIKACAPTNDILVFSTPKSCYPPHTGGYYFIDTDSII